MHAPQPTVDVKIEPTSSFSRITNRAKLYDFYIDDGLLRVVRYSR